MEWGLFASLWSRQQRGGQELGSRHNLHVPTSCNLLLSIRMHIVKEVVHIMMNQAPEREIGNGG